MLWRMKVKVKQKATVNDRNDSYQPDYDIKSLKEAFEEIVKEVKERTHYQDDESSSDSESEEESHGRKVFLLLVP